MEEAALAAGAAARGPGAVGSFGGGEGDAWQAGRRAQGKGQVVEQRQQLREQPPQLPRRPLPRVPRENGCGLAAPLSLLPRGEERAAWGSRPPTPQCVLSRGVRGWTRGTGGWYTMI